METSGIGKILLRIKNPPIFIAGTPEMVQQQLETFAKISHSKKS